MSQDKVSFLNQAMTLIVMKTQKWKPIREK